MKFDTITVRGGHDVEEISNSKKCITPPIYNTTAFSFDSVEHALGLFDLEKAGDIYTRISNPTQEVLEKRLAALEGGVGALALSSGQAATTLAITNIAKAGDEIVTASTLYGGTFNLFSSTLPKFGINAKFVDSDKAEDFEKEINEKTKCIFVESLGNPKINVADLENLAKIAHKHGIPLIVDNTVATPYFCNPFKFGADIVVHSTTKYINGHGNTMGGVIIDSGNFDWTKYPEKFPELNEPDSSYHGIVYTNNFGKAAYIVKARTQLLRDIGCSINPMGAYLTLLGLETLHVRMDRHASNAQKVAQYLETHPNVEWVSYPTLKSHPQYDLAQKYMPKGCASLLGFGIKGTKEQGIKFIESVKLLIHATNIGDVRSILTYPAATTHRQLSAEELIKAGVSENYMRVSVGLEDVDDIIDDIEQALKVAFA